MLVREVQANMGLISIISSIFCDPLHSLFWPRVCRYSVQNWIAASDSASETWLLFNSLVYRICSIVSPFRTLSIYTHAYTLHTCIELYATSTSSQLFDFFPLFNARHTFFTSLLFCNAYVLYIHLYVPVFVCSIFDIYK